MADIHGSSFSSSVLGAPTHLDLVLDMRADEFGAMASALVEVFATGRVDPDRFADDLLVDLNVPEWRMQVKGRDAVEAWLRNEVGEGNDVETLHWLPAGQILVLEIVTRGRGEHGGLSRQLCVARHERGLISSLVIYCTGVWDAALQARHHTEADLVEPGLVWAGSEQRPESAICSAAARTNAVPERAARQAGAGSTKRRLRRMGRSRRRLHWPPR